MTKQPGVHRRTSQAMLLLIAITMIAAMPVFSQLPFATSKDTSLFGKNPKAGKYLKIRGFNMYYEMYGTGKPLLIIHGNGGSIRDFRYQIPYFSKEYKVIIADSRAQGKSVDDGDSLNYEMMADDLNELLVSLKVDSAYVIGWSDGGVNGLLLAMRHPERVKKLAVTGANLWPDSTALAPFFFPWGISFMDSLKKAPQTPKNRNDLKLVNMMFMEPHITIEQLSGIKCPVLVIGGDHDVIVTKHTLQIAEAIPRSYLWILPNSGHSTPQVYRTEFNNVIGNFFKQPYRKIEGFDRLN